LVVGQRRLEKAIGLICKSLLMRLDVVWTGRKTTDVATFVLAIAFKRKIQNASVGNRISTVESDSRH
jgi:hypothetical protein